MCWGQKLLHWERCECWDIVLRRKPFSYSFVTLSQKVLRTFFCKSVGSVFLQFCPLLHNYALNVKENFFTWTWTCFIKHFFKTVFIYLFVNLLKYWIKLLTYFGSTTNLMNAMKNCHTKQHLKLQQKQEEAERMQAYTPTSN